MGKYSEPKYCRYCNKYKSQDRTSYLRHEKRCQEIYEAHGNKSFGRQRGRMVSDPLVSDFPIMGTSSAFCEHPDQGADHEPLSKVPLSILDPAEIDDVSQLRNAGYTPPSRRDPSGLVPEYELSAIYSRLQELEDTVARFSVVCSQVKKLEAKLTTVERWLNQH